MSTFTNLIRSELDRRDWNYTDLSIKTEEIAQQLRENGTFPDAKALHHSSISYFMKRETIPELPTLHVMALALDLPLRQLVSALGFPIDTYQPENAQRQRMIAQAEGASPDLMTFIEEITSLQPEDRRAVRAFMRYLKSTDI